ncbi:2-oxoglutarate and iron-dependent oxygenase domain-containing protein [Pseudonocardia benzenivorans]
MTAHPPGTTEDPTVVGGFVPVVDVGGRDGSPARRREIARAIDTACRESGFFGIVGHGVDLSLIQRMHDVTVDLFSTPDEDKAALLVPRTTRRCAESSPAPVRSPPPRTSRPRRTSASCSR